MAKISARKLFLFGRYSLALLLPKKWLNELDVKAGEKVQLEFDSKRRRIVVRISEGGNKETATPTNSSKKSDPKKPKGNEPEDWQPIPQL